MFYSNVPNVFALNKIKKSVMPCTRARHNGLTIYNMWDYSFCSTSISVNVSMMSPTCMSL